MKTTYLAHTPYHVLLAAAMAESEAGDTELVLVQDSDSTLLAETVTNAQMFDSVTVRPGLYGKTGFLSRRATLLRNIVWLQAHLRRWPPETLVVFNDRRQDAQAALHACPDATAVYAEDGVGAYSAGTHTSHNGLGLALRKLAYGYWYQSPRVLGTTDWIDEVWATTPDGLRPELQSYPVNEIPANAVARVSRQEWVGEYLDCVGIQPADLSEVDLVLAPTHSSFADSLNGYHEAYESILQIASKRGVSVAVKYHPRDEKGFLQTSEYDGVTVLPNQVPFEFVAAASNDATVLGDISTVLLTAAAIRSTVNVYSIAPLIEYTDKELFQTFERVNVGLLGDWAAVKTHLN